MIKNRVMAAILAATQGKKLIAETTFNQGRAKAMLELRDDEIWVCGKIRHHKWDLGPEIKLSLPEEVKQTLLNGDSSNIKFDFNKALKLAWHEAAKQNDFFKGVDVLLQNRLIAKKVYNNGLNAAFFEIRKGSEFWVYGKFYDPRGVRGPEVNINLNVSDDVREELLLRDSWIEPMSENLKKVVSQAWKLASEQLVFFKGLSA